MSVSRQDAEAIQRHLAEASRILRSYPEASLPTARPRIKISPAIPVHGEFVRITEVGDARYLMDAADLVDETLTRFSLGL